MKENKRHRFVKTVLDNMPSDWINLTTHRLDIYNESLAKTQFLDAFENLYLKNNTDVEALNALPTAYDYIRLGHPLSSVLEWTIAHLNGLKPEYVISFSSQTIPLLAILRHNLLHQKKTRLIYADNLPECFDTELIKRVYGYDFELIKTDNVDTSFKFEGSTVLITKSDRIDPKNNNLNIDFFIDLYPELGSVLMVNGEQNEDYVSDIQHVRRRETIAMTPSNCLIALKALIEQKTFSIKTINTEDKANVLRDINSITNSATQAVVGSSGLSIQYAIMMGLIQTALDNHKNKAIKFIVPTNCYGGTNDQARRVAACLDHVDVLDLEVDGNHDMVKSIDIVLNQVAAEDAVPYIIAEIPTNPRVEVPDLEALKHVLSKKRKTTSGKTAIDPVFILDQTFCPNIHFLGENDILSVVKTISYVSGSKFPSGGKCTAGYCVANKKAADFMVNIAKHLDLCDNGATALQYKLLAKQMPTMNQRIADAYANTRDFVNFIHKHLPKAKINFVSEELAAKGFTPSVFSLDLPTKGNTPEEKENYKRTLNHKLIHLMITKIPEESKHCVSYGQLKGVYWTIPATSTQGTTKEGDKDYIARVSLSPNMNLNLHKKVFLEFVKAI